MKLRHLFLLAIGTLLLSACNMTLAADVTPPPGYVSPTPPPTLGPLYPDKAPDLANGKAIFTEKCAACHGATGLGDGEQSKDLPVSVIPIGLPEFANEATLSSWYAVVTQGRIERFMPPFNSLTDQERWDVVAYALTLHTTNEQLELGKKLFEENCADCGEAFTNLQMMSALSEDDIVKFVREGNGNFPAFGSNFSDEEAYAVAAYIHTLTFATPAAPVAAAATETPSTTDAALTPAAEGTPADGTPQAEVTPEAVAASVVKGQIINKSSADLPVDLQITLRGFDHGSDPSAGPTEVLNVQGTVNPDGSYSFDVELLESQIYLAELDVDGITYQSEFAVVPAGATELALPDITVYDTTTELTDLVIDSIAVHFDYTDPESISAFVVYLLRNTGDKNIKVQLENDNQDIPFIKAPANAKLLGFQQTQDGATLLATKEQDGFYIQPSDQTYGLIAFSSIPRSNKVEFSQEFLLPVGSGQIFLPNGVTAQGDQITDQGLVPLQDSSGKNYEYQTYSFANINANSTLDFTLKGDPSETSTTADVTQNQYVLIGVGAFGLTLILAGVFMYMRDRKKAAAEAEGDEDDEEEDDQFEDTESIMDAIIVLDDLHRAGKISDEAYKKRRTELTASLKKKG